MEFGIMSDTGFGLLAVIGSLLLYSPLPLALVGSVLLLTVGRRPPVVVGVSARLWSLSAAIACAVGSAFSLVGLILLAAAGELSLVRYFGCMCFAPAVIGSIAWIAFTRSLVVRPGGISVVPHDSD